MMEEVVIDLSLRDIPKDKYRTAYFIVVLLGCGFLFPYNSFITAVDYFTAVYPDYNIEFGFPAVYTISLLLSMIILVKWGRGYSFTTRIAGPFVCFLIAMVAVPIADGAVGGEYSKSNELLFFGTLFLIFVVGVTDAIAQGSIYGLTSLFPPLYSNAVQTGNGVAGLVVSILRIITKLSLPDDASGLRISSMIYFSLSAVTMLFCIVGYFVLMRLPITKHYLRSPSVQNQDIEMVMLNEMTEMSEMSNDADVPKEIISTKMVIYKIWKMGATVCFVFFITLLGFPGLITTIPPSTMIPADWYPIVLISSAGLTHNFDWTQPKRERLLYIFALSRTVFILLFVAFVHVSSLQNEIFVIFVDCLFAFSGGFLGSVLMMTGPSKVDGPEREVAGTVMSFFLVLGLCLGASVSFCVEKFVKW